MAKLNKFVHLGHKGLRVVNDINSAFDSGENVAGVFLDLSQAFDFLNRKILFKKLEYLIMGKGGWINVVQKLFHR